MTQSKHTSRTSCLQNWNLHSVEGHDKQNQTQIKKSKRLLKFKKKKRFCMSWWKGCKINLWEGILKDNCGWKKAKRMRARKDKIIFFYFTDCNYGVTQWVRKGKKNLRQKHSQSSEKICGICSSFTLSDQKFPIAAEEDSFTCHHLLHAITSFSPNPVLSWYFSKKIQINKFTEN